MVIGPAVGDADMPAYSSMVRLAGVFVSNWVYVIPLPTTEVGALVVLELVR
jgi:hypothetical protein